MRPFSYTQATEAESAIATVSNTPNAKFIAGGTTMLDLMKLYVETPSQLVDINALPLSTIKLTRTGVRIGALARMSEVAQATVIRARYPVISEALLLSASAQLRNMALGGIGTKPWRSPEAERVLRGKPATVNSFDQAAEATLQDAKPLMQNAFKVELAKRTLVRALETVSEMPSIQLF